ncbi:hypothetical protein GRJ2_002027900 [Grus japonensis]|uniref:Uncharacterized protein n=1 Tax=Grus japonensis TaxID=30415 RepID=A0ABC9XD59_GRUJA
MPGVGASDQLKEEDGAHQKYRVVIIFRALPMAKDAAEGRRHPCKQFPSHSLEKGIEWEEQSIMTVN